MEYHPGRSTLRGFPVEFAVLGLLIDSPLHGYALRSRLEEGLGPLWRIASSQLYQVLHRLEEHGSIAQSAPTAGAGPEKTIYSVTGDGMHAFWEWAQSPVSSMRNVRVEFVAKLYFLRRLRPRAVGALIDRQLEAVETMASHAASSTRQGSDDEELNDAWSAFQTSTIANFARWLAAHRDSLTHPKESHA